MHALAQSGFGVTPARSPISWDRPVSKAMGEREPLSRHALCCLRDIKNKPAPTSAATCGAVRGLLRLGYIEPVMLPSPIPADKGKMIKRLQITISGRQALEGTKL